MQHPGRTSPTDSQEQHVEASNQPPASSRCPSPTSNTAPWYLGHQSLMVATLQNHSGIHNSTADFNTANPRHKLSKLSGKAPSLNLGQGRLWRPHGHKATDTELTYAPVSQAYAHCHKLQFNV